MFIASKKTNNSLGLWLDLYELTMAQSYFYSRRNYQGVFELFIRSRKRPFYLACGLEAAAAYATTLRFSEPDLLYLRSLKIFKKDFLDFLKNFRFRGDIYGVEEGEIVFASEPLLRVEGNLIEAQIIESALLNIVNLNTTLATKAVRIILASGKKPVYDFSLRRTQGLDASLAAARGAFLAGAAGTSNVLAGAIYKIPVVGTMAHSFVMSFKDELDGFLAFWRDFGTSSILLIDTYDIKSGLENVIRLVHLVRRSGSKILGVRIDSGDLAQAARFVRRRLDQAGMRDVIIVASGDLDEYKIKKLTKNSAPIDAFGVGTNLGTSSDLPFTDVVYKLVEVGQDEKGLMPLMKLSEKKLVLPGAKDIERKLSSQKIMAFDRLLSLRQEKGRFLLRKLISKGRQVFSASDVFHLRAKIKQKISCLPPQLKSLKASPVYRVKISPALAALKQKTKKDIRAKLKASRFLFFDVDTQNDFVDPRGRLYVKGAEKIKRKWQKLTELAIIKQIKIIASLDSHKRNDKEFKQFPAHCVAGSWGEKKIKETLAKHHFVISGKHYNWFELLEIKDNYEQIIIKKNTFDVFSNPNTQALLDVLLPEEVYVYGLAAEFCVKAALKGLLLLRAKVFLVKDAVLAIDAKKAESEEKKFRKKGLKVISTKELVAKLKSF